MHTTSFINAQKCVVCCMLHKHSTASGVCVVYMNVNMSQQWASSIPAWLEMSQQLHQQLLQQLQPQLVPQLALLPAGTTVPVTLLTTVTVSIITGTSCSNSNYSTSNLTDTATVSIVTGGTCEQL